jgi:hypothetical protein
MDIIAHSPSFLVVGWELTSKKDRVELCSVTNNEKESADNPDLPSLNETVYRISATRGLFFGDTWHVTRPPMRTHYVWDRILCGVVCALGPAVAAHGLPAVGGC